jgi:hypothetical protein
MQCSKSTIKADAPSLTADNSLTPSTFPKEDPGMSAAVVMIGVLNSDYNRNL